ncbi:HdeA/HdeB family protein [Loktanella atrilutea]|uniref:HdeA/HdeB family protein n=1 Tax=Loktanella atrilutea TaxID=366533 RepID=A0A1M5FTS7_LOKAT|nr:hypothetical protein [Loktanella atrilutea]SHF94571.1 HdeA/HdeB family protein [Loktanella atrilutea]
MIRNLFLSTTILVALSASPLFAAAHSEMDVSKMTCAELMAMDMDGMMAAATAIDTAMKDMPAGDAMAADGVMSADGAMAADGAMSADGAMVADGAMTEEAMMKMKEACVGKEDMMVMDVMHETM